MRRFLVLPLLLLLLPALSAAAAPPAAPEPSLVSFASGALVVQTPQEYGSGWAATWIFDENPGTGWATPQGVVTPQTMVVALSEKTVLKRLEFDTASVDGDGRGAKDILVEVSDTSATEGFKKIAEVTLADRADNQKFPVAAEVPGRWVRLTVKNNHGDKEYIELMDFRAMGTQLTKTPLPDVSGTYESDFGDFHLRQQGNAVSGCYEHDGGLIVGGGIEGRVMSFTWREEGPQEGPAVMVFAPGGGRFFGLWWNQGDTGSGGIWNGTRKSAAVGTCPHWTGGAQEQIAEDLEELGRTRIYGINFDTDSDVIREESRPTLDRIAAVLKGHPDWKLTVEGHTDATGSTEHNRQLSQKRAEAVKAYLQAAGIDAARLQATGLGATRPVASNDTALGRAQNRRVELAKR